MIRYQAAPQAVFADVPGGGCGVAHRHETLLLTKSNWCAHWALLEAGGDPDATAEVVATEYDIPVIEAVKAVSDLVVGLVNAGLLRVASSGTASS